MLILLHLVLLVLSTTSSPLLEILKGLWTKQRRNNRVAGNHVDVDGQPRWRWHHRALLAGSGGVVGSVKVEQLRALLSSIHLFVQTNTGSSFAIVFEKVAPWNKFNGIRLIYILKLQTNTRYCSELEQCFQWEMIPKLSKELRGRP